MLQKLCLLVMLLGLLSACTGTAAQPSLQPAVTLPPNVTPLVTQIGVVSPANHYERIKVAGRIRVGTSADYPPFEYFDGSGTRAGFDIELMEEIAGRMGVLLEWIDLPFNELIGAVQSGKIDAAISAFELTPERDAVVDFTQPYFTAEDAFVALEAFPGQIAKPGDAAGYIIGVQSGTAQEQWIKDTLVQSGAMAAANLVSYAGTAEAVAALQAGTVQLMMADLLPAQNLLQTTPGLKVVYQGVVSGGPIHIIVPQDDTVLTQEINLIIERLRSEGFIEALAIRFINEAY